jgi:hypothetical protein
VTYTYDDDGTFKLPYFDDVSGQQLKSELIITQCMKGGYGDELGLLAGDVIIRYGDKIMPNSEELVAQTGLASTAQIKVLLQVRRNGVVYDFQVKGGRLGILLEDRVVKPGW